MRVQRKLVLLGAIPAEGVRIRCVRKLASKAESASMRAAVQIKNIAFNVLRDVDEKHIMAFAAGLSYYFVLSVFPLLIFVSAVVAYLPVSSLFNQIVGVLATVVPPDS